MEYKCNSQHDQIPIQRGTEEGKKKETQFFKIASSFKFDFVMQTHACIALRVTCQLENREKKILYTKNVRNMFLWEIQ